MAIVKRFGVILFSGEKTMCALCSSDEEEKKAEKNECVRIAKLLSELSKSYEDLAYGTIKPHSDQWMRNNVKAFSVIRVLVEDWV